MAWQGVVALVDAANAGKRIKLLEDWTDDEIEAFAEVDVVPIDRTVVYADLSGVRLWMRAVGRLVRPLAEWTDEDVTRHAQSGIKPAKERLARAG